MPYRHGPVPGTYNPSYLSREYQRISEAYDYQDCLGGLALLFADGPIPQTLDTVPALMNCWLLATPELGVGDGPVQTDPRVTPQSEVEVMEDGIFLITTFANFSHDQGAYTKMDLFINGIFTGLGAIVDSSQQSNASTMSFSSIFPLFENDIVDVRASTDQGSEDIEWLSCSFQLFKLRDLRTRFS